MTFEVCACAFEDGNQVMWCDAHLKSRELVARMRDADAEHMRTLDREVTYLRAKIQRALDWLNEKELPPENCIRGARENLLGANDGMG